MIGPMTRLVLGVMLTSGACDFKSADGGVEDGNEALAAGKVDEAVARYKEAAERLPESPPLNYDRGLAASLAGDHEGAASLLLRALETKDAALDQKVKAAIGIAYAREALAIERNPAAAAAAATPDPNVPPGASGATPPADDASADGKPKIPEAAMAKWKLAVDFLEDALVLDPNDAESRRTLEVALMRVDPPCATRDDKYEENDNRLAAKGLEIAAEQPNESKASDGIEGVGATREDKLKFREQLFSCPDDPDWYTFDLHAGDRVKLVPTVPADAGRLAFVLERPDGRQAWTWTSAKDAPTPSFEATIAAGEAGSWRLSVDNVDVDEVSYGLEIVVRPACATVEDRYEDNDDAAAAKTLTPGPVPDLKRCPGDDDWYAVQLAEGESLFLYAQPAPDPDAPNEKAAEGEPPKPPPFRVEVLSLGEDGTAVVRAKGAPIEQAQVSTLLMPGAGRYLVRVHDEEALKWEGRYALQVEVVPPCPEGDDRFEDNDVAVDATDFMEASQPPQQQGAPPQQQPGAPQQQGPPVVFARVCPGDVDWWKITAGDKPQIMSAVFDHAQGDLALELFDDKGVVSVAKSDTSSATQNGESVALPFDAAKAAADPNDPSAPKGPAPDPNAPAPAPDPNAPPKVYALQVSAKGDAQNFYLLRLDSPSGGGGDQGDQDQDPQASKDPQDPGDDKKDPRDQGKPDESPLQDALDNLDKNPENLPARDAARKSPLAHQKPTKDW